MWQHYDKSKVFLRYWTIRRNTIIKHVAIMFSLFRQSQKLFPRNLQLWKFTPRLDNNVGKFPHIIYINYPRSESPNLINRLTLHSVLTFTWSRSQLLINRPQQLCWCRLHLPFFLFHLIVSLLCLYFLKHVKLLH